MYRRKFIARGIALLVAPLAVEAQRPVDKIPRIGVIGERSSPDKFLDAFRQGMGKNGYTEGRNIIIEYRYAQGVVEATPRLVDELIGLQVDVLVVGGTLAARAAKAATTTIPIVFAVSSDPVGAGLVESLARPGGNATGLSNIVGELSGKQLELLKAAVPKMSRVGVLNNPINSGPALIGTRAAASALGVDLQVVEVRVPSQLKDAFMTLTARHVEGVLALSDPVFFNDTELARLASDNHLPAMYARKEFAEAGGLLAYGPNFSDNWRRAADYVDKILKGAKPADLPVEQPTKFELVINLKAAKRLGITIPQSLLQRADEVIE